MSAANDLDARRMMAHLSTDSRFLELTPPPPNPRYALLYAMTGDHTGNVPGLFRAGRASMAECLNWPVEGFDQAWAELEHAGLAQADWALRVVWVPVALEFARPMTPNVVKGWAAHWASIPDCPIKRTARAALEKVVQACGPGFVVAFEGICSGSPPPGSGKPRAKKRTGDSSRGKGDGASSNGEDRDNGAPYPG